MMRVLHFSDLHQNPLLQGKELLHWSGKRLIGATNLILTRRRYFEEVEIKVAALDRFRQEMNVDLVICTGDYTVIGTASEHARTRKLIEPLTQAPLGFVTVPGNHDIYLDDCVNEDRFGNYFGDLLKSDLPEVAVDGVWPLVRFPGEGVAVIAVNSARPNPQPWRSSGHIPQVQLKALGKILAMPEVAGRFVFILTHYAPRLAGGRPDNFRHGLTNAEEFLKVCSAVQRGAILFGHIHRRYAVKLPELSATLFCAGSVSQKGREGLWLFDVDGDAARAVPGRWDGERYVLEEAAVVEL
jgi:3',5'-cyclic AMP phosphodiesterase CpdA